jgi:ubiquinol-cytochrome c reductase cytochrome b subunit
VAALLPFFVAFLEGGNDIIAVFLHVPVEIITRILQLSFFIAPVAAWLLTYWVCRSLQATHLHPAAPTAGQRLRRTASGGYETVSLDPGTPAAEGGGRAGPTQHGAS